MSRLKIVVGGYIGLYPTGGATWDYIQYPLGLKMLGHDVYYIEDTGNYPIYQLEKSAWDDCSNCVKYLQAAMASVGMDDRWAYRDVATGRIFGMSSHKLKEVVETADVFINVSASTILRDEYLKIPVKILIDTDPMFTQFQYHKTQEEGGTTAMEAHRFMEAHNLHFTFGLNIGQEDCRIPEFGFKWLTTKKPICLEHWRTAVNETTRFGFTSILNWTERPAFTFDNESWGQKNVEFAKFYDLPSLAPKPFDLIINRGSDPESNSAMEHIKSLGWNVLSPHDLITNKEDYRRFIQSSYAEFSVTKETYIKSNSGWFSGRSACYLAAAKPVITQDTRWSNYIPAGEGLFACNDLKTAHSAVKEIAADYERHSKAALAIAHEYFDSSKVLTHILEHVS
ncbi:MAG: hypothetical protein M3Q97_07265 [Bacteroidota bacterium]|nr:hypothetical protein [Bacteroidota bacterium]